MKFFSKEGWEYKLGVFIILYYVIVNFVFHSENTLSSELRVLPFEFIENLPKTPTEKHAYVQYATNNQYFNLAILNFIKLTQNNSRIPTKIILISQDLINSNDAQFRKLAKLARENDIKLKPIKLLSSDIKSTWSSSLTKLHVFNLIDFDRIVYFDSDSMLVNDSTLDELFDLPKEIQYALPQAYWLNNKAEKNKRKGYTKHYKGKVPSDDEYKRVISKATTSPYKWENLPTLLSHHHKFDNYDDFFATHIMVIEPNKKLYNQLLTFLHKRWYWKLLKKVLSRKGDDYDMEIINKFLNQLIVKKSTKIGILPHQNYGVLTGEFRELYHARFLVQPQYLPFINKFESTNWNLSELALKIKLIHFSDSPIPKPWERQNNYDYYNTLKIYCSKNINADEYKKEFPSQYKPRLVLDCDAVDLWNSYFDEFREFQKDYWLLD